MQVTGADPLVSLETALAGAILAAGCAAFAPITVEWTRRMFPRERPIAPGWGFPHVLLAAVLFILFQGLYFALTGFEGGEGEVQDATTGLIALAAIQGTVCAVVVYWARRRDPEGLRCLGFRRDGNARAGLSAVVVYLFTAPGLLGIMMLWPWLLQRLGQDSSPQAITEAIAGLRGGELVLCIVLAAGVVPLFEELFFRGFLQPVLVERFGAVPGIAGSALVFAIAHPLAVFLPIFGLALVLGGVQLRTGRIAAAWTVHALHNGLMISFLLS